MKLYNLFPPLVGPFEDWTPHLQRAAAMGFDWIFVNPIQRLGRSGSLYSIADYFAINEALLAPDSRLEPDAQVQAMADTAGEQGLSLMIDLVINHCAEDSPLLSEHPAWFLRTTTALPTPFVSRPTATRWCGATSLSSTISAPCNRPMTRMGCWPISCAWSSI